MTHDSRAKGPIACSSLWQNPVHRLPVCTGVQALVLIIFHVNYKVTEKSGRDEFR